MLQNRCLCQWLPSYFKWILYHQTIWFRNRKKSLEAKSGVYDSAVKVQSIELCYCDWNSMSKWLTSWKNTFFFVEYRHLDLIASASNGFRCSSNATQYVSLTVLPFSRVYVRPHPVSSKKQLLSSFWLMEQLLSSLKHFHPSFCIWYLVGNPCCINTGESWHWLDWF